MQDKEIEKAIRISAAGLAVFFLIMFFIQFAAMSAHKERIADLTRRIEALEKQGRR